MDVLNGSLPNTAQRIYPVGHQQIRLIFNFLKKLEFNPSARSKGPKSNEAYSVDVFNSIINILAAPYSTVENSYSNISKIQDHKILFKTKHPYSRTIYKYNPPPNNQRKTIMVKPFYISIMDKNSGNVGNRMFMYMYARILQNLYLPNSEIVNFSINEFGIDCRPHNMTGRILSINGGHKHSMNSISYFAKNKIYDGVFFHGYVQRMEYYPCVDFCSSLFPNSIPKLQINDNEILINIRGAEILRAVHPDYVPVPIDFIEQVLNETGLSPVIMGQIGNDFYSEELKKRIPHARLIKHSSMREDFDLIRNSKNIILSVSTFSWIAAWLSKTNQKIHLPMLGFLNPKQRNDINLLPIWDDRYVFYKFPEVKWIGSNENISYIIGKGKIYDKIPHDEVAKGLIY